jgi:predicted nucleic acid-binding protein
MILVDTGVLVDYLRTKDAKLDSLFRSLPVAVCGVIRAELLAGARDAAARQHVVAFLAPFLYVPMPEGWWDLVGDNLRTLRANGITVPFPDAVIATVGMESGMEVWARDPHYRTMQGCLSRLRLYQEPP